MSETCGLCDKAFAESDEPTYWGNQRVCVECWCKLEDAAEELRLNSPAVAAPSRITQGVQAVAATGLGGLGCLLSLAAQIIPFWYAWTYGNSFVGFMWRCLLMTFVVQAVMYVLVGIVAAIGEAFAKSRQE